MLNKTLLLQVRDKILEKPHNFLMDRYFSTQLDMLREENPDNNSGRFWKPRDYAKECGTACCIAGWAFTLAKTESKRPIDGRLILYNSPQSVGDPHVEGAKVLGITPYESIELFYVSQWPEDLANEYRLATTHEEQAQVAAKRIDRFIQNYENKKATTTPHQDSQFPGEPNLTS